ncbi:sensor histidine kinase [Nocardioides immobilis]|uniref:histidine kinase n=1 Tax=Nocardioides immobilis TaxID=2049295 RepID=A0A417Y3G3_9ACTN|nr:sensor histidine kinase [Nocardioides immobilis]RHW27208.1 sensor histidine kinase [Nocardioides immobilis]
MESGRPSVVDLVLTGVLTAAALTEALLTEQYDDRAEIPLAVIFALPLLVRRSRPLWALAGVMTVLFVQRLAFGEIWDAGSSLAIPMVAVFAVAAYSALLPAAVGLGVAVVAMSLADIGPDGPDVAFLTLILGAIWLAGLAFHRQRRLVATVAAQALELEAAAREREELAAAAERTRIARELHDVVAHAVSTIVVQAEAGQALQQRAPDRAADAFVAIQTTGRQALDELRRMLGVLRDSPGTADLAPLPGLTELPALVDSARASGLDVDLVVDGHGDLAPGPDLTAYRVVQEALTNILKHASATRATIRITHGDGTLRIEVADDGRGDRGGTNGAGHGLTGMRERAQLHGGTVDVVSTPSGFTVRVDLVTT